MTRAGPIAAAAAALLLVLVGLPLAFIVWEAVSPPGSIEPPFVHFFATLGDPRLLRPLGNTVLLGIGVAAGATALGAPLAIVRGLFRVPCARFFDLLLLVPFLIPPYIATLGWIMLLQRHGYLDQIVGVDAASFLYSFGGVIFVMSLNLFPIVYFSVSRTVAAIGSRFGEAARIFGATPASILARITLPLAAPGFAASLLIVFALAIEEYGTPAVLSRQSGFVVLVTAIATRVADFPVDLAGAAALSLVLVGCAAVAFAVQERLLARRSFVTVGGKPGASAKQSLGAWSVPVTGLFALVAAVAAGAPLFSIFATGLSRTLSGGLAASNLSLDQVRAVVAGDGIVALMTSFALAAGAALVTGFVGVLTAYATVRLKFRGKVLLDALSLMPSAVPGIVVAVGLILCWNEPALPVTPYNTPFILLLAYSAILLPYPVRYAGAAFRQIGDDLDEAARLCGASASRVLRAILLPLVLPSLASSMLLVFAVASRELVASLLLVPPGMATAATFIWRQFEQGSVTLGMAMTGIVVLVTLVFLLASIAVSGRFGFPDRE